MTHELLQQAWPTGAPNWLPKNQVEDKLYHLERTAIIALKMALSTTLQPISTAPMDGTKFLGLRGSKIAVCYRIQRVDCEAYNFGESSASVEHWPNIKPTHWLPLPQVPSEQL